MDLKDYQRRVVDEVDRYLRALADEHAKGNRKHGAKDAWEELGLGRYEERRNGLNEDLPTFCIKVPTGGGKTLIATQALGSIHRSILRERNGAGLVLWVVPSSQIYRDTLRRLRDRQDMYRLMLEHAVYSVISPEGCAAILWEDAKRAREAAEALRVTAPDCLKLGVIDGIVPEPPGGAHRSWERAAEELRAALRGALDELRDVPGDELVQRRYAKFRRMGVFEETL